MQKRLLYLMLIVALIGNGVVAAQTLTTDVVVVGAGGAGMSAAIEAADAGADVVLLEKMPFTGGSTMLSLGVILAAGTSVQEKAGIVDSPDDLYEHWMSLNQFMINPGVIRRYVDEAPEAIDWLIDLGVDYSPETLYNSGVVKVLRGHRPKGDGAALAKALNGAVKARQNINLMLETPAIDLITEDGRVIGVIAQKKDGSKFDVKAKAVVLATGGFARNEEMMRENLPHVMEHGKEEILANMGSTGDGIIMAQKLGADAVLTWGPGGVHSAVDPMSAPPVGAIYVNKQGVRFVDETLPYVLGYVLLAQENGQGWVVVDSSILGEDPWSSSHLDKEVEAGRAVKADDLWTLAEKMGINPKALENTVERYNADAKEGIDSMYLKESVKPLVQGPYYASQLLVRRVAQTAAGLFVTPRTEVLTTDGGVIEGLFAAGEITATVGPRYTGGGAAVGHAIIFGRVAGQEAAKLAMGN